jgi:hypothetical protein
LRVPNQGTHHLTRHSKTLRLQRMAAFAASYAAVRLETGSTRALPCSCWFNPDASRFYRRLPTHRRHALLATYTELPTKHRHSRRHAGSRRGGSAAAVACCGRPSALAP